VPLPKIWALLRIYTFWEINPRGFPLIKPQEFLKKSPMGETPFSPNLKGGYTNLRNPHWGPKPKKLGVKPKNSREEP